MRAASISRAAAVVIAAVAAIDPAVMREASVPAPLTIVTLGTPDLAAADRLRSLLSGDYDITVRQHSRADISAACPAAGGCVVVSTGEVPHRLTAGAIVIGAVQIAPTPARVIASIDVPARVSLHAMAPMTVTLAQPAERVEIFDGDMLVARHDTQGATSASVTWMPVAAGPRALRVRAGGDEAVVAVDVSATPLPVYVYEPQASWLATFVRRALEDDRRFDVRGGTRVAPPIVIARGDRPRLSRESIHDVPVVVVGAPDALSSADVDLLTTFVEQRGGSLVLLLDAAVSGPVRRLLPAMSAVKAARETQEFSGLRASEWLEFAPGPGIAPIGNDRSHTIVSRAAGRGRVMASGLLDAWRYRDDPGFALFWTALAADAAVAAGDVVTVRATPRLALPGEPVGVDVRWQWADPVEARVAAEARYACVDDEGMLRLWPGAAPGTFAGTLRPAGDGPCRITATINGVTGVGTVVVARDAPVPPAPDALRAAIDAHGGQLVTSGDEAALAAHARRVLPPTRGPVESHPMRSIWWIIPFASALGYEWWDRRRRGKA